LKTATASATATFNDNIYLKKQTVLTLCPENANGRKVDLQN
jgi:hypothetical protein